jgi:hypothetical protein
MPSSWHPFRFVTSMGRIAGNSVLHDTRVARNNAGTDPSHQLPTILAVAAHNLPLTPTSDSDISLGAMSWPCRKIQRTQPLTQLLRRERDLAGDDWDQTLSSSEHRLAPPKDKGPTPHKTHLLPPFPMRWSGEQIPNKYSSHDLACMQPLFRVKLTAPCPPILPTSPPLPPDPPACTASNADLSFSFSRLRSSCRRHGCGQPLGRNKRSSSREARVAVAARSPQLVAGNHCGEP